MRYLFVLALLLVACQPATEPSLNIVGETAIPPRPTITPEEISLGKDIYAQNCVSCHGVNLEGEPDWKSQNEDGSFRAPPHDETGHTWHHNDSYLIESIKLGGVRLEPNIGVSAMPAYDGVLSDAQIAAVLAYIKSSWPSEILEAQSTR